MSQSNKKVLGAGAAMVALSAFVPNPFLIGEALAQATAQDTMNITAKVVNPLKMSEVSKLNLGTFAVSAASGTITFKAGGTKGTIKNGILITQGKDGKVNFTAPKSALFTISVPVLATKAIKISAGGGGAASKTMTVDQILLKGAAKLKINGAASAQKTLKVGVQKATAKITSGTKQSADIGGRAHFKPTNIVGSYTGTYTMLITF